MAIHPHNNENETQWNRGNYKVMIKGNGSTRAFAYCDGSQEDKDVLLQMAEDEGLMSAEIIIKPLKNEREVWTLSGEML
jgi:hypothetical protein